MNHMMYWSSCRRFHADRRQRHVHTNVDTPTGGGGAIRMGVHPIRFHQKEDVFQLVPAQAVEGRVRMGSGWITS